MVRRTGAVLMTASEAVLDAVEVACFDLVTGAATDDTIEEAIVKIHHIRDAITAALDEAEVRGRAEAAAKVEALATLVEQGRAWTGDSLARRLRALVHGMTR